MKSNAVTQPAAKKPATKASSANKSVIAIDALDAKKRDSKRPDAKKLGDEPIARDAQKQITRSTLLQAVLEIMSEGRGFGSLSLREITARAGLAPAAFYRHFANLEELGLALVEACGVTLRRLLRDVRRTGLPPKSMLLTSVSIYQQFILDHRAHFVFITTERSGGSPALRTAIRREEMHFSHELSQDLRQFGMMPAHSSKAIEMTCSLVVGIMMLAATEFLDLTDNAALLKEWRDRFVKQLRLVFLGALAWKE
jgi:TetR/AcrR family transcriptional regulator, fatty acid biosynthesis regulator